MGPVALVILLVFAVRGGRLSLGRGAAHRATDRSGAQTVGLRPPFVSLRAAPGFGRQPGRQPSQQPGRLEEDGLDLVMSAL